MPDTARWTLIAGASGGSGETSPIYLQETAGIYIFSIIQIGGTVESAAQAAAQHERSTSIYQTDLTDPESAKEIVQRAHSTAPLSAVVYAAGPHIPMKYTAAPSADAFGHTINSDLNACFHLLRPALKPLRETQGEIVAVTTPAADRYAKRDILSAVPKSGMRALIRGIATE